MPKLSALTLRDDFQFRLPRPSDHHWYIRQTKAEFEGAISTQSWGDCWGDWRRDEWDFSGVYRLYDALAEAKVKLDSFSTGPPWAPPGPLQMFAIPREVGVAFGSQLKTL